MMHLKPIILTSIALIVMPVVAAYLFPLRLVPPVPEPAAPVSPKIVYCLPPAQPNDLTGAVLKTQRGLVNVGVNDSLDQPGHALHVFVAALKVYPRAQRVRASWHMQLVMNNSESTVLYDRRKRSLVFFDQESGDLGTSRDHVLYTEVPDGMFVRLADAHRDDNEETPWGCFDDLSRFGCRKRDLGSWVR